MTTLEKRIAIAGDELTALLARIDPAAAARVELEVIKARESRWPSSPDEQHDHGKER